MKKIESPLDNDNVDAVKRSSLKLSSLSTGLFDSLSYSVTSIASFMRKSSSGSSIFANLEEDDDENAVDDPNEPSPAKRRESAETQTIALDTITESSSGH